MENKGYADFGGVNKVYYGECGNGECALCIRSKWLRKYLSQRQVRKGCLRHQKLDEPLHVLHIVKHLGEDSLLAFVI